LSIPFLAAQHLWKYFTRPFPKAISGRLDRLSNRLTKILSRVRKLNTPEK
jgi:hypothetical protein